MQTTRWLFLRLLGAVYLIAFVSLWVQVDGLIGSQGISPVAEHLDWIGSNTGAERYWKMPTLLWLDAGDGFLHLLCGSGAALALLLIAGVAPIPVLIALWAIYLSMTIGGQVFLAFQWDALLLETGFAALLVAPATLRPRWPAGEPPVPRAGVWLIRVVLFKLIFLSGIVKLISMDETWWKLTALDYHYWTQPLPTWTSWYADRLPGWIQRMSVFVMFVIELVLPLAIFLARRLRLVAFAGLVFLQLMIAATGNYGFFNLLTVVLCIMLLDDRALAAMLPGRIRPAIDPRAEQPRVALRRRVAVWFRPRPWVRLLPRLLLCVLFLANGMTFVREIVRTRPPQRIDGFTGALFDAGDRLLLSWGRPLLLRWIDPLRSVNGYGLFRAMTTTRPELVIEGSHDGKDWREYRFKWKPVELTGRPRFVQPHQPRLDWQMWFAALSPRRASAWLQGLSLRLLEGSPAVVGLLDDSPFVDRPPTYVRWVYYDYRFATADEKAASGAWWSRSRKGILAGPLSLESFDR